MRSGATKQYVDPDRWRTVILLAALGGILSAGLDVPLRWAAEQIGWNVAVGSRISAGGVILIAPIAQCFYPHRGVAILALLAALISYVLMTLLIHGVLMQDFPLRQLAVDLAFVGTVDLAVGAIIIASLQKTFASRVRIGYDPLTQCTACGYSLQGLTEARCPECGRPFEKAVETREERSDQDIQSIREESAQS